MGSWGRCVGFTGLLFGGLNVGFKGHHCGLSFGVWGFGVWVRVLGWGFGFGVQGCIPRSGQFLPRDADRSAKKKCRYLLA